MKRRISRLVLAALVLGWGGARGEAPAAAVATFNSYIGVVEGRLAAQHRSRDGFRGGEAGTAEGEARLRRGEFIVEHITPPMGAELAGAMLHHWRGSGFAKGATAADFERLLRDFNDYPEYFSPQVIDARTIAENGDRVEGWMRVRERHGITVVTDSTYVVEFGRLDALDRFSASRSTRIAEIEGAGTSEERVLGPRVEHGFLWRMNTYWSWEERDGGLYMQVESVSLTRGIPAGLGWAVRPFVESIPRESVEFTLGSVCRALQSGAVRSRVQDVARDAIGERER